MAYRFLQIPSVCSGEMAVQYFGNINDINSTSAHPLHSTSSKPALAGASLCHTKYLTKSCVIYLVASEEERPEKHLHKPWKNHSP